MRENNDFVLKRDTINLLQARPHYIISYTDIKSYFQKKDIFPKDWSGDWKELIPQQYSKSSLSHQS